MKTIRRGRPELAEDARKVRRIFGLAPANLAWLQAEATRRGVSMAHIVNELIERERTPPKGGEEG